MSRKQQIYADFSGGFNDSVAALSIDDTEVCLSENADYSAEMKSFRTRKGCVKVNSTSFGKEVTDAHTWSIGSLYKKVIVIDGKLYDYNSSFNINNPKITLTSGAEKIYPFVMYNKFYFGDGSKLYVWGDYDYSSETTGTISVTVGQIVRNNTSTTGSSVKGHFYQALVAQSITLTSEDYSNTTNWTDVTEVSFFASSVIREVVPYDPSKKEVVKISVLNAVKASGTVTINLNNVDYVTSSLTTSVSTISGVLDALMQAKTSASVAITTDWDIVKESNYITLTKKTAGLSINGYVDPGATGVTFTFSTETEGSTNDNNLDPIKKCTIFVVHTDSYRVFAAGNPDDNAIFYSEIGNPAYFKSDYNKVYALNSYGKPTGMLQLSDSVLISFENGWYSWDGVTPLTDATWKPLNIPYGAISNRTIVHTPYSFMFLGNDGIYNISASILSSELVLLQGEDVIDKISRNKVDNVIKSIYNKKTCEAIFYNNVYYLAYNEYPDEYSNAKLYSVGDYCLHNSLAYVCITAVETAEEFDSSKWSQVETQGNKRVLKFEWDTNSYTEVTGWKVNSWFTDNTDLFFATKNYLLKTNTGECDVDVDDGENKAIELHIKTKEYSFGNPILNKVVNIIGLILKQDQSDYAQSVDLKVIMGYDTYDVGTLNLSESLVWGRNWGLTWGFREAIVKIVELNMSSNTFQLELTNDTINSPVTIIGIGFVYEPTEFVTTTNYKDEELQQ